MRFIIYTLFLLLTYAPNLSAQKVSFTPFVQHSRSKHTLNTTGEFANVRYEVNNDAFGYTEFGGRFDLTLFNDKSIVLSIGAHNRTITTSFITRLEVPNSNTSVDDQSVITNTKEYIVPFLEASYQIKLPRNFSVQPILSIKYLTEIYKNKDTDSFPGVWEEQVKTFIEAVEGSIRPTHLFFETGLNVTYRRYGIFARHGTHLGSSITDDLDDGGTQLSFGNSYKVSTIGFSFVLFR
ncbi:hypothetical protein [Neolewinella antarctica]|uniref:Outer membrane protein beta-barrel domain-containing protein n=1 Tax=Neolewinella antarctica TaxID=442734 RepID=A0ABX0XAS2_9BACT|nr:hypothetical protein [Neolewinella antarctica]NJC25923.1 hypothetical protein [Neolewinella antarctica]